MNYFVKGLCCLIILSACTSNNKVRKEEAKLKANHTVRVGLLRLLPEPTYDRLPDSMKKWVPVFRNVLADDQKHRIIGYNRYSAKEKQEQLLLDSQNLVIVTSFLDKHGWPLLNNAGYVAQRAVGMCVQHAPLQTQQQYFPYLAAAFKKDKHLQESLALLEDRINVKNNKYQYYGSQMILYKGKLTLYPVLHFDSIDVIRKRAKLLPMQQYMSLMKIDWNIETYKKILPQIIIDLNISDTGFLHIEQ